MRLPINTIWNQNNRSDRLGDLWSSLNLNLISNVGGFKLFPRFVNNLNSSNNVGGNSTDLGIPWAAKSFSAGGFYFWLGAGTRVFQSTALNTAFTLDGSGNTPSDLDPDQSDMEVFNNFIYVSGNSTSLHKVNSSGVWSAPLTSKVNNANGLHDLEFFRPQNRLYFVDDNAASVGSINTADTPATLGAQYSLQNLVTGSSGNTGASISWIKSNSQFIFIGTLDATGKQGRVYYWDGSQLSGPNGYYTLEASGSLACVIKNDVPVILDTKGRLLQLNGASFVELARLPYSERIPPTFFNPATQRMCHYNGMTLVNDRINIFIRGNLFENGNYNKENIPSGVWEYTQETGLYHKGGPTHNKSSESITDYGQQKLLKIGCIASFEAPIAVTDNGRTLIGCEYYTTASATNKGLFYDDTNDTLQKAGAFTTSKMFSANITDTWQEVYLRFRKFLNATDKMVVKYRIAEDEPTEATITYTSTTTFTVPASSFTTAPVAGDEVEILQGIGASRCAHITTVTGSTTLTVTVDETITGATSQTAVARFQTWKKLGSYSSQSDELYKLPIDKGNNSVWVQFKVWILWTGKDELYDLTISNKFNEAIE